MKDLNMQEQLITLKTAKLAKKKGFKNTESAPTQSLLQKWIRETHQISIIVDDFYTNGRIRYDYKTKELGSQDEVEDSEVFQTYEEALEAGLVAALNTLPSIPL